MTKKTLYLQFDSVIFDTRNNEVCFEQAGKRIYSIKAEFAFPQGGSMKVTGLNGQLTFDIT